MKTNVLCPCITEDKPFVICLFDEALIVRETDSSKLPEPGLKSPCSLVSSQHENMFFFDEQLNVGLFKTS